MPFKNNLGRIALRALAGVVALVSLASCGGGTYQENPFVPARILTFGDENSTLVGAQGLKYSINGISTSTDQVDCALNPLWNQVLASSYNIVYQHCNSQTVTQPTGFDYTTLNATVDDAAKQVAAFQAGDSFNGNDLVTLWVGMHDVLNEYTANGSGDDVATLTADMQGAGAQLAALANSIVATGAKLILVTVPDMGTSPYAATENERGDFDRATLLSQMTLAFNNSLRGSIVNDGSKIGLVLADDFTDGAVRSPGSFGLISNPNLTQGCQSTAVLPNCTDDTLNTDAGKNSNAPGIWLWADQTHLAPTAHQQIGNQAVSRAHTNPF
ncbi:MAG TPA: SGNH/GDSL hydrolase family protein [Burkholderiaceae bacterium]